MTSVESHPGGLLLQGDIIRDVALIEDVREVHGHIEVSQIVFPLVIVLTQGCDLEQERGSRPKPTDDKTLISVLCAPLYNVEHVFKGEHLSDLELRMQSINRKKTEGRMLRQNRLARYHHLSFPSGIPIVDSAIDFKHYFSVSMSRLEEARTERYVVTLGDLHRELLSQRFAAYLSRIGLP